MFMQMLTRLLTMYNHKYEKVAIATRQTQQQKKFM